MNMIDIVRAKVASLTEQRQAALATLQSFETLLVTEQRSELTADETAAFDAAAAAVTGIDADLAAHTARAAELERIHAATADTGRRAPLPGSAGRTDDYDWSARSAQPGETRARALSHIEQSRMFASDAHKEAVTKLIERSNLDDQPSSASEVASKLVLATTNPTYFRAWSKSMQGIPLTGEESGAIARAMTVGTTTAGGFYVPSPIDPTLIITGAGSTNPFRRISTVKQLGYENVWKGVSAGQITASFDAEGVEVSDDTATYAQPVVTTHMARVFVPFSMEAEDDIQSLVSDIAALFADAKDNLEADKFAVGSGSAEPQGIHDAIGDTTASRVGSTTTTVFGLVDVYKLHQALPVRHRLNSAANRAIMANVITINTIRQFATANNYHGFLVDLGSGQPPQLLGEQLIECPSITSTVTTGADIMLFGDFRKFYIADKVGFVTEMVPHLFSTTTNLPNGQRGLFGRWRVGSNAVDTAAFRVLRLTA
jgi:HK97 family phage major capsid protein